MKYKLFGGFLILLGIIIFTSVLYRNSQKRKETIVFTPNFMLDALWHAYKDEYWDATTGKTIDKQRQNITTSEGQSYTLLRAVWQDDKATFDKTLSWTQASMQHKDDHLFSWVYGSKGDGTEGILTSMGGQNAATDADTDIAMALLFASKRWNDPKYQDAAKSLITDIWNKEVTTVASTTFVAANDVEKNSSAPNILVNPSYFAPYAYRMFAVVDPGHDWMSVVNGSYTLLASSTAAELNSETRGVLPPDWFAVDRATGELKKPTAANLDINYSFDALRIPWRLALDWKWYKDPRAKSILDQLNTLSVDWQSHRSLASIYGHSGKRTVETEVPAMYGGSIGYFILSDSEKSEDVVTTKLTALYNTDSQTWKTPLGYYDDNWAWFGLALYYDRLPNLAID